MNNKGVAVKFLEARTTGNILHQEYNELYVQNVTEKGKWNSQNKNRDGVRGEQ